MLAVETEVNVDSKNANDGGPVLVGSSDLSHRYCSATAPVSYPTSLRNFPNGCQGHPRSYPPRRIARCLPNRIQVVFGLAADFYSTMA